ncbi:MAG: hypothetical protein AB7N91_11385 [Candidatus Tectimicrobiota bacterium]
MRYSNSLEIIAMTLLWGAVLIWYDIAFNQHFFQMDATRMRAMASPQVSLWLKHIGCSNRPAELQQVLGSIPWLGKVTLRQASSMASEAAGHAPKPPETQCDLGLLAEVRDVQQADFVELEQALAQRQIVPSTFEFGGLAHFAVRAQVANLCSECVQAANEALIPRKDAKLGSTFKWLDSKRVNLKEQTITAFVRFNHEAHLDEISRALEQAGFPLLSLRVVVE